MREQSMGVAPPGLRGAPASPHPWLRTERLVSSPYAGWAGNKLTTQGQTVFIVLHQLPLLQGWPSFYTLQFPPSCSTPFRPISKGVLLFRTLTDDSQPRPSPGLWLGLRPHSEYRAVAAARCLSGLDVSLLEEVLLVFPAVIESGPGVWPDLGWVLCSRWRAHLRGILMLPQWCLSPRCHILSPPPQSRLLVKAGAHGLQGENVCVNVQIETAGRLSTTT